MDEGDWFTQLFGFSEADAADVQRKLLLEDVQGTCHLLSTVNGEVYNVGCFRTPSLADLIERATTTDDVAGESASSFPRSSRLSVETVMGDVSVLHAMPENRHATFQVASQFNCLEFAHPSALPESGVTNYVYDRTQV